MKPLYSFIDSLLPSFIHSFIHLFITFSINLLYLCINFFISSFYFILLFIPFFVHLFIPSLILSISQTLVFTTPRTRICRPLPPRVGGVHPHELVICRLQQMSLRVNSPPTYNTRRSQNTVTITARGSKCTTRECNQCSFIFTSAILLLMADLGLFCTAIKLEPSCQKPSLNLYKKKIFVIFGETIR